MGSIFNWFDHLVLTLGTLGGAFGSHFCLLASGCQSVFFGSSGSLRLHFKTAGRVLGWSLGVMVVPLAQF